MYLTHRETGVERHTRRPLRGDLVLLVLEILIPVALVNLIDVLTIVGYLPELYILNVPFYESSMVACGVWAFLVLNYGPFLAPKPTERRGRE
jgi:hypothetical protein